MPPVLSFEERYTLAMQINPQAVFARLQARIAQLELDKAVAEAAYEDASARLTVLEEEHAKCTQAAENVPPRRDAVRAANGG